MKVHRETQKTGKMRKYVEGRQNIYLPGAVIRAEPKSMKVGEYFSKVPLELGIFSIFMKMLLVLKSPCPTRLAWINARPYIVQQTKLAPNQTPGCKYYRT